MKGIYMVKVSIVIPTVNRDLVVPCVESVIQMTTLDDKEIVIVANGANKSLLDDIQRWKENNIPVKCLWYDQPLGPVPAYNRGVKNAVGEYIVILNDDIIISSSPVDNWIKFLIEPLENDPMIGATGPCLLHPVLGDKQIPLEKEDRDFGFLIFFCVAIPRRVFEKIGYFDELLNCAIDIDFCLRLRRAGYTIKQVPDDKLIEDDIFKGDFPIYHKAEETVHNFYGIDEWNKILERDAAIIRSRYGRKNISIVIPAYGDCLEDLQKCIISVLDNTPHSVNMEIIVVANGCKSNVKHYLKNNIDKFKYLWFDDPLGFPKAVNTGVLSSNGEIIIILNQDAVILGNSWIKMLTDPFYRDEKVGMTGPLKLVCEDVKRNNILLFCAAVRRKVFDEVGLLDEQFYPGCFEDVDFTIRVEDAGWKTIQVPENTECVQTKDFIKGGFPIYHVENHFDWISRENFERNRQLLIEKYSPKREIIMPNWPLAQKKYEVLMFQEFFKSYKIDNILEIGRYKGGMTRLLAHMASNKVYSIDINDHKESFMDTDLNNKNMKQYDGKVYINSDVEHKIVEFNGDSHSREFIEFVKSKIDKVDLIFIDGDHSYEGVKADFINFLDCLKPGGYVAFHDILDSVEHTVIDVHVSKLWKELKKQYDAYEFIDNNDYGTGPCRSMGIGVIRIDNPEHIPILSSDNSEVKVSAYISTKDRYNTTLPMAIMGVISQTHKIDEFILFDDSDNPRDLINDPVFSHIFGVMERIGIRYRIIIGERIGQVANHQKMLTEASNDLIWRVDDDNYPMPNVLERLVNVISSDSKIGAVGSASIVWNRFEKAEDAGITLNELEKPNLQWTEFNGHRFVEHLHNTFLFRKQAASHGYPKNLSPVGHREETMFTHDMYLNGWKLVVVGDVITWHLQQYDIGGIRVYTDERYWIHDEEVFKRWKASKYKEDKVFILDSGIGDHLEFLKILPKIKEKYYDKNIILATCYPEVFEREGVEQISIGEAIERYGEEERRRQNIYEYMDRNNWTGHIKDAYAQMHGV